MDPERATKIISPLSDSVIERNRRLIHMKVVTRKSFTQPEFEWRGLPVYHFGDDANGYYVQYSPEKNAVLYFVAYKMIKGGGIRFGRQILVWADRTQTYTVGLAPHIFWKILLPRFKALIADTQQTDHGRAFWRQRLGEALSGGHPQAKCYAYDRRSTPNALYRMTSDLDVDKYSDLLWGSDEGHLRTHAVISNQELRLRS